MKKITILFCSLAVLSACNPKYKNLEDGIYADMETDRGSIVLKLYTDATPLTVANFVSLAEGTHPKVADSLKGKKFYDGLTFHRVIKDFMIQGGDPLASGAGTPGYRFSDEIPRDSSNALIYKHDEAGILSMANSGPGTNGCQFFITHKPTPWLDGKHTVFGKVVTGQDVVDSIAQNDFIKSVKIVRRGSKAKSFDAPKVFEDELAKSEIKEKERLANKAAADKIRYDKFLADKEVFYKKMDVAKAKKSESGLQTLVLKRGKGKKFNSLVPTIVNYTLYLADGKMIKSTEGATPFTFTMDKQPMITGFKEAILKMRVGDKSRLFIPYYLAYGEAGGGPFPPKADIIFELELLKVGE